MKETCTRIVSFRPEEYLSMEIYLNQMHAQGWRLQWCKGILANFKRTDNPNLHYMVDPYAVTSISNIGRFSKRRLSEYMENGWYSVGKIKGSQIFCTEDNEGESPDLEEITVQSIRKTCSIASLILALLFLVVLYKNLTNPMIVYNILLTDIYIVLSGVFAFFGMYHLINGILLLIPMSKKKTVKIKKCKRFIIHDGAILGFFFLAIWLEARQQSQLIGYLFLPIGVVVIGSIILKVAAKKTTNVQESNKRLIPIICSIGLVLLMLIPISINNLQESSKDAVETHIEDLLLQADTLAVAHISDFMDISSEVTSEIQQNSSILGNNILYTEELEGVDVFTNHIRMSSEVFAKPMFDYLYRQAQIDYNSNFKEQEYKNISYYKLEKEGVYLLQKEAIVYFCVVPNSVTGKELIEVLLF